MYSKPPRKVAAKAVARAVASKVMADTCGATQAPLPPLLSSSSPAVNNLTFLLFSVLRFKPILLEIKHNELLVTEASTVILHIRVTSPIDIALGLFLWLTKRAQSPVQTLLCFTIIPKRGSPILTVKPN